MKGVIQHGCVLESTLESWVKPIVKDKRGNREDSNNYRGISLVNVWAKIMDNLILGKINGHYQTDECQFGFKKKLSSKMAVQVLVEMGHNYCKLGGNLICGFVDITKAFDRLQYKVVWDKLKKIGIGENIVRILREQYLKQYRRVIWGELKSEFFMVDRGVRQGSPLSPILFALVMDDVVQKIKALKVGCVLKGKIVNIIVYADDIVVFGPTRHAITEILRVLSKELHEKGLEVNLEKNCSNGNKYRGKI